MNKTYCFTDIHGMLKLWIKIKEYCDETDKIYFLGDAIDRGEDGLEIMRDLLLDKRVIYLKGNHEEMFEEIAPDFIEGRFSIYANLIKENQALKAIKDFSRLGSFEQDWIIKKIKSLPTKKIITNESGQKILLSHSGTSFNYTKDEILSFSKETDRWLWDREHFLKNWNKNKKYDNWYIVHGHTPVQMIRETISIKENKNWDITDDTILNYENGHKFALDIATYVTRKIALFNLDTLKVEKYFEY